MSGGPGRLAQIVRLLALVALLAANAVLIGLNLQKHEIFPFDEGQDAPTESDGGGESAQPASSPDQSAQATTTVAAPVGGDDSDVVVVDDDWPGVRGDIPDGPPVIRAAVLSASGAVMLTGSVPSWAVAEELADRLGRRLPGGVEAVEVDYTWHPMAEAKVGGEMLYLENGMRYEAGQVSVPADAEQPLGFVIDLMSNNVELVAVVTAHIDDLGDTAENRAVALARAAGVADRLTSGGIDPARVVTVVAPPDPGAVANDDDVGRQFNRRVEVGLRNVFAESLVG